MKSKSSSYRLIVSDVDGTLVDSRKRITPFTNHELRRVIRDYGLELVLASTRMPCSLVRVQKELSIERKPFIAYNGALLVDPGNAYSVYSLTLKDDDALILIDELLRHAVHVGVFSEDKWFVSELDYWALREVRGTGVWPNPKLLPAALLDGDIFPVHKVMARGDSGLISEVDLAIRRLELKIGIWRDPRGTIVELTHGSASKAAALQALLSTLGLPSSSVIAFGDSYSDYSMMELAGMSIALNNAPGEVRAIANEITLSNDEDGVGYALRKHFPTKDDWLITSGT
jgi:Cof subfamily protein (haloacid dehalogenase superfamily)